MDQILYVRLSSLIKSVYINNKSVLYLWCKELLNPTGQERFVQHAAD